MAASAFTAPSPLRLHLPARPHRRARRTTPKLAIQPRRSKMILTRRVHTWTLKPPPPPRQTPPRPAAPAHGSSAPATQPGYIFRRPSPSPRRRPADPPSRYLQLTTGAIPLSRTPSPPPPRKHTLRPAALFQHPLSPAPPPPLGPLPLHAHLSKLSARVPRLIVIGDLHGCITEFRDLLKLADYTPGDQVLLLGDLVAKGPDSTAVIQHARELDARFVRGNHDYEVIRHTESPKTRNEVSPEHARIARSLSPAEHNWLMDAPWFVECQQMNYLFVHAGFIPGVKLTQQNPRLMMNMRSVLEDGTVTARHVVGCEWGRLWNGPQTVVFGHDAYRGLQRYEYALGIDTGCVYGGRLTALLLPENRLISVAARRAYISPKRFRAVREMAKENAQ